MAPRILMLATFLACAPALSLAQLIQLDPSQLNQAGNSPKDSKLVSMPPVPSQEQQQFQEAMKDIHFDSDKFDIRSEDRAILAQDGEWLKAHPNVMITLEGDADERGDVIYNVVLSGERAMAAKDALVQMSVPEDRIAFAAGWGKLYPVCAQSDESCWSQNRRTHFATWPPAAEQGRVASAQTSASITAE